MGTDHLPHGYRKSFSLMGKVKSCSLKVLAYLSLLNKRKKQKLIISVHTQQYFNYLDFFTGNILFLGQILIFEVFPCILTAKGGEKSSNLCHWYLYGQKPLFTSIKFLSLGTVIFSSIFDQV